jgi:hypothetical protein
MNTSLDVTIQPRKGVGAFSLTQTHKEQIDTYVNITTVCRPQKTIGRNQKKVFIINHKKLISLLYKKSLNSESCGVIQW